MVDARRSFDLSSDVSNSSQAFFISDDIKILMCKLVHVIPYTVLSHFHFFGCFRATVKLSAVLYI